MTDMEAFLIRGNFPLGVGRIPLQARTNIAAKLSSGATVASSFRPEQSAIRREV